MASSLRRRLAIAALVSLLALSAGTAYSAGPTAATWAPDKNFQGQSRVEVLLGIPNVEDGLRMLDDQPDGQTQPSTEWGGRQSLPNDLGSERYFYFDVHPTYISGGKNTVQVGVSYQDVGLTPIYLEYDSFDPLRPDSRADDVIKKRVTVTGRTNSEGQKTTYVTLEDARFASTQPGGADFRIFASDALVLKNVSVWFRSHADAPKPIRVTLDGKPVAFDPNEVQPFIQNNRTLVPMRATFNALGISNENITWHNETRTVEARKGDTTISLTIDDARVLVNGLVRPEPLDQPATIVAGRTVVPLRFVATQFGLKVDWNQADQMVILTTLPKAPTPTQPTTPTPTQPTAPAPTQPTAPSPVQPQPKP